MPFNADQTNVAAGQGVNVHASHASAAANTSSWCSISRIQYLTRGFSCLSTSGSLVRQRLAYSNREVQRLALLLASALNRHHHSSGGEQECQRSSKNIAMSTSASRAGALDLLGAMFMKQVLWIALADAFSGCQLDNPPTATSQVPETQSCAPLTP